MRSISICFLSIVLTLLVYGCFSSHKRGDEDDFGFDETDVVDSARISSSGIDGGYAAAGRGVVRPFDAAIIDAIVQSGTGGAGGTVGIGDTGRTVRVDTDDDAGMGDAPCAPNCPEVEWVTIPGGAFMMGSAYEIGSNNERPQHEVNVQTFKISKTEITVAQYGICLDEGICSAPFEGRHEDNWGESGRENHPVNSVDWDQAREFAEWIGARLPSEAEWEYAARNGGQDIVYPWGNEEASCEYAVIEMDESGYQCGNETTMEVCSKPLGNSTHGLCDMAGNVWEWVEDDWHNSYNFYRIPSDGEAWIDIPRGAWRVLRGGSWSNATDYCRAAVRHFYSPDYHSYYFGFRVVLDLE